MPKPIGFLPTGLEPLVRPMFRTLGIAASGLSAQRLRMETIATNVANAETTHTEGGGPYRRRVVEMQAGAPPGQFVDAFAAAAGVIAPTMPRVPSPLGDTPADAATGVTVSAISEDPTEGPLVYQPGHPDANADGYVRYPNVNITNEMVDMMDARRLYEANATVFQATKSMLQKSIEI
jgi:flagellar basal-body rod protein FlgC